MENPKIRECTELAGYPGISRVIRRHKMVESFDTIRGWLGYLRDTKHALLAVAFKYSDGEAVILCLCM